MGPSCELLMYPNIELVTSLCAGMSPAHEDVEKAAKMMNEGF